MLWFWPFAFVEKMVEVFAVRVKRSWSLTMVATCMVEDKVL